MTYTFDELYQAALFHLTPEEAGPFAYQLTGEQIENEAELRSRVQKLLPHHTNDKIDAIINQIVGGEE